MNQKLFFSIAFQFCLIAFCFAQSETQMSLYQKVIEVKQLAKQGYDNYDPKPLIRAAEILMENPQIRPIKTSKLPTLERSKYFDPNALLLAAYQYTPKNKRWQLKRIEKKQGQISDYETMTLNEGRLWVQEIESLNGGEAMRYSLKFAAEQNIEFRLDNLGELSLSLHYAESQPSLKKAALDTPILFDYTASKTTQYDVEVKNLADSQAMDMILMIML